VDKIERTAKLLKCISTCEYIVHLKWLIDSKLEGKFKGFEIDLNKLKRLFINIVFFSLNIDPNDYEIRDEKFEKHYNCSLKESLERARNSSKRLFSVRISITFFYQDL